MKVRAGAVSVTGACVQAGGQKLKVGCLDGGELIRLPEQGGLFGVTHLTGPPKIRHPPPTADRPPSYPYCVKGAGLALDPQGTS